MTDTPFSGHSPNFNSAAISSFPITTSDSADLATPVRMVTVSGSGTIAWRNWNGIAQSTGVLPPGSYPMMARRILSTGTTATGLTGWV